MLFNSTAFVLGFLPLTLSGFFAAGRWYGPRAALLWLLAADLVFYGWWNPLYLPLLAGSVAVNYGVGHCILRYARDRAARGPREPDRPAPQQRAEPPLPQAGRHEAARYDAARIWLIGGIVFNL